MTSGELANAVLEVCLEAQGRILREGDQQYSQGDRQKFDDATFGEQLKELEEELLDCINHSAMTLIKLRSYLVAFSAP